MEMIEELIEEINKLMENEKSFVKKIKSITDKEEDNLSKKAYKHLKKLEFYLDGGEEMFQDVLKTLDKFVEKNRDKENNKQEDNKDKKVKKSKK